MSHRQAVVFLFVLKWLKQKHLHTKDTMITV